MSNFLANIIKGIVGRLKPPTHQGRFKSIGWLQEKILKHEDDQQEKSNTLNGLPVYYQRPDERLHTYDELFVGEMYRFQAVTDQPVILDCGANIGLSVLYFKQLYPHANIWAFEPDENNFRLLEKNIAVNHLSHVQAVPKAVWVEDGYVSFLANGTEASRITDESLATNGQQVPCVRLAGVLRNFDQVDFLKMDIEGGEHKVIPDCADELHRVRNLFLEYHGRTSDNIQLTNLLSIVQQQGFMVYIRNAADSLVHPFTEKQGTAQYDVQLNIFCYKK